MSTKKIVSLVIVVIVLAGVGIGGYLYYNGSQIAQEILRERIIEDYNTNPKTKYLISLEKIKLNIFTGSVQLLNLSVIPKDSLVAYKPGLDKKVISSTSLVIHIDEVSLKGFDLVKAFTGRTINVESWEINQPKIKVYKHLGIQDTTLIMQQDTVDFKSVFISYYDTFRLAQVDIIDASSTYYQVTPEQDTFKVLTIKHLNYQITKVLITESTMRKAPFIAYDDYNLSSKHLQVVLHNNVEINLKSFQFESNSKQLTISNVSILPLVSPQKFFKQIQFRKAWIKLEVEKIQIKNLDYKEWLKSDYLQIEEVAITNPVLNVHTNSNLPFAPNTKKQMLGQMLTNIPVPYAVERVTISNAQINLDIKGKLSDKHGKLSFNNMDVSATNLTNIPDNLDSNAILDIKVNTRVNNTGNVTANLAIDMSNSSGKTKFTVLAKNLKLTKFNSILKPIASVEITSGKMISLKLSSNLNSYSAQGKLDAHYTNLKLLFLSKDPKKQKNLFLNVVSGLANGYLKNNSIPGDPSYHQGKFKFTKDPTDSFFKMLWLCHLHGLEDAIIGSDKRDNRQAKKRSKSKIGKKTKK